jgi:hypothetical protein
MRPTDTNDRTRQNSMTTMMRTCSLAVLSLSLGLAMSAGAARAGDDDRTFTEKVSDGFYGMIRGWPKDPDERARKAVIAAKKKNAPPVARVQVTAAGAPAAINIAPPVTPEQTPIPGTTRPAYANEQNGTARTDPIYDKPGDLFTGGAADLADSIGIGNLFGGSTKTVQVDPGTEPARQALTQPPVGYQTPSPSYAYGEQKKGWLDGTANPDKNPQSQMSSASSVVH